jgi:hypothetical protein
MKKTITGDVIAIASGFMLAGAGALFLRTGLAVAGKNILPYLRKVADK